MDIRAAALVSCPWLPSLGPASFCLWLTREDLIMGRYLAQCLRCWFQAQLSS